MGRRRRGIQPSFADERLALVFGTASGFGSAFMLVRKTIISRWFSATPSISVLLAREKIEREVPEWTLARGSCSGRTAWQYIQDLAGRLVKAAG
jgi:predicted AAA+ superfamily ATPase